MTKWNDGISFLTRLLLHHLSLTFCMYVSQLMRPYMSSLCVPLQAGGLGLGHGWAWPLPALCLLGVPAAMLLQGLGRASLEPGSAHTWLWFFSFQARPGTFFASLRFPSESPFHHPCTLLQAMPERELWPAGPGLEPVTHIGSCDSMMSTTSTLSGSVCTLCLQPGPLSAPLPCPALPTTILAHCSLSFISLVREWITPVGILPLSHPWFYRE